MPDAGIAAHGRKFTVADAFGMFIMRATEHDPEKWKPVFRKIMLNQQNEVVARSLIGA
jgi:hypothetical protein